jgi:hypothetical protein
MFKLSQDKKEKKNWRQQESESLYTRDPYEVISGFISRNLTGQERVGG